MSKQLLVESIRIDGKTQSRERINDETVADYAELMTEKPGGMPPITVFFDGTEYWLSDGFHRLLAANRIGLKNIDAEVKKGTQQEAAWESCAANQAHGLRRTNADKRKAVTMALGMHPEMSDRAIANHVGVGHDVVSSIRRVLALNANTTQPETEKSTDFGPPPSRRIGQDGRSYKAEHKAPTAPAKTKTERGPVDDMGRLIPAHIVDLWDRRDEVSDMLKKLSDIRVALRESQEVKDRLFAEVSFSSVLAHIDQAYSGVQVAKPYAVCPFCQGEGCKACVKRGFLSKYRWDTIVNDELKANIAQLIQEERENPA